MSAQKLTPDAAAEARRILNSAAKRLLAEKLATAEQGEARR